MIYKKLHISLIFSNLLKSKPLSTNPRICNLYTKFVKILEICKQFSHNLVNEQGNIPSRGPIPKFSDLEVVALSLTAESESIDSEKWLFDYKLQEYKDKIPNLISRRQLNDRRKRQKCLKLRNVLLWNKKRMVIISASLILPFLLRVLGAFGERDLKAKVLFLFNSNSYSLQKSSAIQQISIILLISFRGSFFCYMIDFQQYIYKKTILFLGFY